MSRFRMFALTTPCTSCPFRRVPPREGVPLFEGLHPDRVDGIAASLREGSTFSCHKTVDYSDEEGDGSTEGSSLCAGAMATMANEGEDGPLLTPAVMQVAHRLGYFHPEALDTRHVYGSLAEWQAGLRDRYTGGRRC